MTMMLTLFGQENLSEMTYDDLHRELRSQKAILTAIKQNRRMYECQLEKRIEQEEAGTKKGYSKRIINDKLTLFDIYAAHLESLIEEIEYHMGRKTASKLERNGSRSMAEIKARNLKQRRDYVNEANKVKHWKKVLDRDTSLIPWDKDKFMLIAKDRGYQTEEAIVWDVSKELNLDRTRTGLLLNKGRFTWGQVLCIGAMFEMTPKEFCDTFLSGYFTDQFGEYRADYENANREELLKRAVIPLEEVEVGSDGKPVDEEVWFD